MQRNTSISLSDHYEKFIADEVSSGRYSSASEVIGSALKLLEAEEKRLAYLRQALQEGEDSGFVNDFDALEYLAKLNKKIS